MPTHSNPRAAIAAFAILLSICHSTFAASGLFPKMPAANQVYVADCRKDSTEARTTALALEGLVNQSRAETYLLIRGVDQTQLDTCGRQQQALPLPAGPDPGLRALFRKYSGRVKKMFVYDPQKDWTFYLALMAAAQQNGIPVTDSLRQSLTTEFGWNGAVVDFRNQGASRIEGYDWAIANLMPGCSHQVVFALKHDMPLLDYAAASKGFTFWLDFTNPDELAEAEKIFSNPGYSVGTSLMGYANTGDAANTYANKYGIGYVVSDFYANGSFWSSFPDKTYRQSTGHSVQAVPGKIYVCIFWSDGDNIQFDQWKTYTLWQDPARGTIPVATTLSPCLQELNTPLLDWYYAKMTPNDELIAGPCGIQFIYGRDYAPSLFPAWCDLSRTWMADAGFHTSIMYHAEYASDVYRIYMAKCGLTGIVYNGSRGDRVFHDAAIPVVDEGPGAQSDHELYESLSTLAPDAGNPRFILRKCIVEPFLKVGPDGYTRIKAVIDRLNTEQPGRYVFLLPKDFFATIRTYYHMPPG